MENTIYTSLNTHTRLNAKLTYVVSVKPALVKKKDKLRVKYFDDCGS